MAIKKTLEDLAILGVSALTLSFSWSNKNDIELAILRESYNNQIALLEQTKKTGKPVKKSTTAQTQTKDEFSLRLENLVKANQQENSAKFQREIKMLYNYVVKNKVKLGFDDYTKITGYISDFYKWKEGNIIYDGDNRDWSQRFYDLYQAQSGLTYEYLRAKYSKPTDNKKGKSTSSIISMTKSEDRYVGGTKKPTGKIEKRYETDDASKFYDERQELDKLLDRPVYTTDDISEMRRRLEKMRNYMPNDETYIEQYNEKSEKVEEREETLRRVAAQPQYAYTTHRRSLLNEMLERHMGLIYSQSRSEYENDIIPGSNLMDEFIRASQGIVADAPILYLPEYYSKAHQDHNVGIREVVKGQPRSIVRDNLYNPSIAYYIHLDNILEYSEKPYDIWTVIEELVLTNEGYKITFISAEGVRYSSDKFRIPD